jgi:hypothetical protein
MVQRQFTRRQHRGAILAGISVAQQDVLPRERPALMRNAAVLEQADHRGQAHGHAGRVQKVPILFFRHGDAFEHQD